ncbi:MAG: signal peptidase II [Fimbriimonadaceae bacterium]|nr:signal peptidase II [Alphaproteobacteria bacterium]
MTFRPTIRFGLGVALFTFLLDQASKQWLLHIFKDAGVAKIQAASFLDFVLVWNQGVSYGLFPQQSELGRWLLVLFSCVVICFLLLWLMRSSSLLIAVSLGLIIGGATGNALDRVIFGAVIDFFSFHAYDFHWYVFNLADAAIVAGAAGLIYDSLFASHKSAANGD